MNCLWRIIGIILLLIGIGNSQFQTNSIFGELNKGRYNTGFQLIETNDYSRFYTSENGRESNARPLRIYLWYPTMRSVKSPMMLNEYIYMTAADFEEPARNIETEWPPVILPVQIEKGLSREQLKDLWNTKTSAIRNADPAKGPFPLIVLGQGLYYESPLTHFVLCEFLASHGYVVVTCPLRGTRNRLVNLNVEDLETQIRDLEFCAGVARTKTFVDPKRLGIIGYDLGGMAGLVMSMRHPDVDAFLSLDSGILFRHFSGLPNSHPSYQEERFTIPWMHITQKRFVIRSGNDQPRSTLFDRKSFGDNYLLLADTDNHGGFTSYAMFGIKQAVPGYWGPIQGDPNSLYEDVCRYSLNFLDGYLKQDFEVLSKLKAISSDSDETVPLFTFKFKNGGKAPLSKDEIIQMIIRDGFEKAEPLIGQSRSDYPDSLLFDENVVNWLGYHLLYWWGREAEAIKVFQLNTEVFPKSVNSFDSLGEAYLNSGDREKAKENYEKVLELDPDNQNAKAVLEQLK